MNAKKDEVTTVTALYEVVVPKAVESESSSENTYFGLTWASGKKLIPDALSFENCNQLLQASILGLM